MLAAVAALGCGRIDYTRVEPRDGGTDGPSEDAGDACGTGELDPRFGDGGRAVLSLSEDADLAKGMIEDRDGWLVAIQFHQPQQRFALARVTATGALDTTFGAGGVRVLWDRDATVQRMSAWGSSLILVGHTLDASSLAAVVVVQRDGTLLSSFATGGTFTDSLVPGESTEIWDATPEAGGGIVAVGDSSGTADATIVLRLDAAGAREPSFGTNGLVVIDGPGRDRGRAVIARPGRILIIGARAGSPVITALDPAGAVDPSFGAAGDATLSEPGVFWDGWVDASDRIVAVGALTGATGDDRILMARFDASGALDPTFGIGGTIITQHRGDRSRAWVGIPASSSMVVGTTVDLSAPGEQRVGILRIDESGRHDPSFAMAGEYVDARPGSDNGIRGLRIAPEGGIVAAGWTIGEAGTLDTQLFRLCP